MMTALLISLIALTAYYIWANEHGKRRDAEQQARELDHMLTASEQERLKLRAAYQRYRADAARRRGQDLPALGKPRLELLPNDPTSKHLGGPS